MMIIPRRAVAWSWLACLALSGCGGVPESAKDEPLLVSITVNVTAKGRPLELDSIALYKPTGEGVLSELPSGSTIATRVVPGTYKVIAIPSSTSPGASKIVTPAHQNPAETPWEIQVTSSGGVFDLKID